MNELKILVVDDDRGNCVMLSKVLSQRGYDVDIAYDGLKALELVRENSYNVAILDYEMPGMNGVELYERLTADHPEVVGIMLTGFATINTVFPAIGAGMDRVLAKPVDFDELIPLIEKSRNPT